MSLQVWLPLNGSVTEIIAGRVFNNTAATIDNNGKIGKCYNFNGTTSQLVYQLSANDINMINNCTQFTIACWVKIASNQEDGSWGQILTFGDKGTSWNNIRIGFDVQPNNSTHFSISNGTSNMGYECSSNNNLADDKWHHLIGIYNNKNLTMYVDGIKQSKTPTASFTHFLSSTSFLIIGGNEGEKPKCSINDVRFYDHALSPREVKLLAQGLVAHYKLDGLKLTNLVPQDSSFESESWGGIATTNSQSYMGNKSLYLKRGTTVAHEANFPKPVVGHKYYGREMIKTNGDVTATDCRFEIFGGDGPGKNWVFGVNIGNYPDWTINSNIITIDSVASESYGIRTFVVDSSNDVFIDSMIVIDLTADFGAGNEPSKEWCDANIPYFIGTYEKSNTIDCSGYGNHGTCSTMLNPACDTPRYKNATLFNNNKYILTPARSYAGMKDSYTFSYWAKIPQIHGKMVFGFIDGNRLNVFPWNTEANPDANPDKSWFNWNTNDSANTPFRNNGVNVLIKPYNNAWHHYVITGNGSETKLYIDGDYAGTASNYKAIDDSNTQIVFSGYDTSANYKWNNGKISDFRIYATALSAAAVKELYQSSISFLDNGTLQCSEIVESPTNLKYNQNGITQAELISEIGYTNKMKISTLPDGSAWAKIYSLDVRDNPSSEEVYFNTNDVDYCIDKANRFSLMQYAKYFRRKNGEYEFLLNYPDAYTQLDYIEATGSQYLETGINSSAKWELDIQFNPDGNRQLMGYSGNAWMYWGVRNENFYEIEHRFINFVTPGKRHIITHDFENKLLTIDGVVQRIETSGAPQGSYTLFGLGASYYCKAKLYRCKCYQGGQLIRDYIPVERKSDGRVGLLDIINGVFYTSSDNNFIKGPMSNSVYAPSTISNPSICNRWAQTNEPDVNYNNATGYRPIQNAFNTSHRTHVGPITRSNSSTSAKYSANQSGNWWSPIGQYTYFNPSTGVYGIPASDGNTYQQTELWVRIDDLPELTKMSMLDKVIQAFQIYEL